jgi:hypothetical protein
MLQEFYSLSATSGHEYLLWSKVAFASVNWGMIQLAWRFLMFQKNSALAQWFRPRTENTRGTRKPMIVALARKLLIALWRLVREGVVPAASFCVPHNERRTLKTPNSFGPVRPLVTGQASVRALRTAARPTPPHRQAAI